MIEKDVVVEELVVEELEVDVLLFLKIGCVREFL